MSLGRGSRRREAGEAGRRARWADGHPRLSPVTSGGRGQAAGTRCYDRRHRVGACSDEPRDLLPAGRRPAPPRLLRRSRPPHRRPVARGDPRRPLSRRTSTVRFPVLLTPPKARWPKAEPVGAAIRGNRLFTVLLLTGILLRLIAMLGYPPALWFNDSYDYVQIANSPFPHPLRSEGYGLFLWLLKPFHSLFLVTGLQHAAVVGMAAYGYRTLVRDFQIRRHWAALALAPVLLDGY